MLTELTRDRRFSFPFATVVKAIVFGRVLHPGSERALVRAWLSGGDPPEIDGIWLHHAYRALATRAEIHEDLEQHLAERLVQASEVDARVLLFDTTSTYFEGAGPDSAGFGFSRDHRADRPQVTLGLLTSRAGTPLAHLLFPGNHSDLVSMARASLALRGRLGLRSRPFILVADRGMVSQANLDALREAGVPFIVGERLCTHQARDALARAGRYRAVTPTLDVKEVRQERSAERLPVCQNLERAEQDRPERERIVAPLEAKLVGGRWRSLLPASARRYVRLAASTPVIAFDKVKAATKYDGKWVLRTTSDLPAAEVALTYRGLWRVERAFWTLKTPLEIRPVYHHSKAGVRGRC